jgi:hypothetical protein
MRLLDQRDAACRRPSRQTKLHGVSVSKLEIARQLPLGGTSVRGILASYSFPMATLTRSDAAKWLAWGLAGAGIDNIDPICAN